MQDVVDLNDLNKTKLDMVRMITGNTVGEKIGEGTYGQVYSFNPDNGDCVKIETIDNPVDVRVWKRGLAIYKKAANSDVAHQ